jgi:hypothetical protein
MESVLEGWREQCGRPRSLTWLRQRAGRLGRRVRVVPGMAATAAAGAGAM